MKKMLKLFGSLFLLAAIFTRCSQNSADPNKDDGETVEQIIERYKDWGTGYSTDGKFKVEIKDYDLSVTMKNVDGNYVNIGWELNFNHYIGKFSKQANNKLVMHDADDLFFCLSINNNYLYITEIDSDLEAMFTDENLDSSITLDFPESITFIKSN